MNNKLKIFDSLRNKKVDFTPYDEKNIRIYACGPTVYDYAHIGNARMAVACDILIRILRYIYPKVTYVSNITDIDDKIIQKSKDSNLPINKITEKFHKIYNDEMQKLNVKNPDFQPKATNFIKEMIDAIEKLTKTKNAYLVDGHVLFHVPSYKHYGCLSRRTIEEQIAGNRIDIAPFKKNDSDFVLWKPSKQNEPSWDSPWGKGRPGWHIECSVMSEKTLGLPFDIHCGGVDLRFPHHENEIAQSCCLIGKNIPPEKFSKYWFHNGFVQVEGEKMSKSIGNIKLINNLLKNKSGECIRLALLSSHYRQPLNWNEKILEQAEKNVERIYRLVEDTRDIKITQEEKKIFCEDVKNALMDDLNTPNALGILNKMSKQFSEKNKLSKKKIKSNLDFIVNSLGLIFNNNSEKVHQIKNDEKKLIEELVTLRNNARIDKDFKKADQIRDELKKLGVLISDTKNNTNWEKIK